MASEPTVIDLGVNPHPPDQPDQPDQPPRLRQWARERRRSLRQVAAALLALALVPLAGSAAPAEPPLELLWTMPGTADEDVRPGQFTIDSGRVLMAQGGSLTAYRLADGRLEWQMSLAPDGSLPQFWLVSARVLVVSVSGPTMPRTVGLDPTTGERIWSYPQDPFMAFGDRLLMFDAQWWVGDGDELQLVDVDPVTGRERHRFRLASPSTYAVHVGKMETSYLFSLAEDGELTRIRFPGGATDRTRTPHAEREEFTWQNQLSADGGLLVVGEYGGTEPSLITAYDPVTLTQRWTITDAEMPSPCGDVVCVPADAGTRALDPVTGEVRWTLDCAETVERTDGYCYATAGQVTSHSDGRLWVRWNSSSEHPETELERASWIVDAETGQRVTRVTSWDLHHELPDGDLLLTRMERQHADESEPYRRMWWARADAGLERLEVLGAADASFCDVSYPYLVCLNDGQDAGVWRVNG